MDDDQVTQTGINIPPVGHDAPPNRRAIARESMFSGIEQMIERIGTRYIDDLRMLGDEFIGLYQAQLAAKDEQIAELQTQLQFSEQERVTLEARLLELQQTGERYVSSLQALSEELHRRIEDAERERRTLEARPRVEGS